MHYSFIILMFVVLTHLSACKNSSMDDIRIYVQKVKSRPAQSIEPLPEIRQHAVVEYVVANLASPFVPPDPSKSIDRMKGLGISPDFNRQKEPLESYSMDSLKMVGVMKIDGKLWAIISDPDGTIYRIKKGNYIGTNFGEVLHIDNDRIEVSEIIPDNQNGWRKRMSAIVLGE